MSGTWFHPLVNRMVPGEGDKNERGPPELLSYHLSILRDKADGLRQKRQFQAEAKWQRNFNMRVLNAMCAESEPIKCSSSSPSDLKHSMKAYHQKEHEVTDLGHPVYTCDT